MKPGATSNMGQGFTVVVAFLFFVSFFAFVLHVTVPTRLFVVQLAHALAGAIGSSSLMGQRVPYFLDRGQAMNKDHGLHLKRGTHVKRSPPLGLIQSHHAGAPCSATLRSSPFPLSAFCQSGP